MKKVLGDFGPITYARPPTPEEARELETTYMEWVAEIHKETTVMLINEMQEEQHVWAVKNFGPPKRRWPAIGVFEELGELAHWQLKHEQGIRGTPEDCINKKKDAVADCVIFALEYCSVQGWKVSSILPEQELTFRELQEHAQGARPNWGFIGDALHLLYDEDQHRQFSWSYSDMSQLLFNLAILCAEQGWDMQDIVETTWMRVRARDWTKNKQNGGDTIDEDDKKYQDYFTFVQSDRGHAAWRRAVSREIEKWRADNNYIPVLPMPMGVEQGLDFFILRWSDPHAGSGLHGYAESVELGVPMLGTYHVKGDRKKADVVRALADQWAERQEAAAQDHAAMIGDMGPRETLEELERLLSHIAKPKSPDCPRTPPCMQRGFHAADECAPHPALPLGPMDPSRMLEGASLNGLTQETHEQLVAKGHSMSAAPCGVCGDLDGCHQPAKLRTEP